MVRLVTTPCGGLCVTGNQGDRNFAHYPGVSGVTTRRRSLSVGSVSAMASLAEAVEFLGSLPEVTEGLSYGNRAWKVANSLFAWERPMRKADIKRWTDGPLPSGPLLAIHTGDLEEKSALLATRITGVFTIEHLAKYPALILQLDVVSAVEMRQLLVDAWLAVAPQRLVDQHSADLLQR
jgi:hypothetical protein